MPIKSNTRLPVNRLSGNKSGRKPWPPVDAVADKVDRLRKRYRPQPVDCSRLPRWWKLRLNWLFGRKDKNAAFETTYNLAYDFTGGRVLDHFGQATGEAGELIFVAEPFADFPKPWLPLSVALIAAKLGVHSRILPTEKSWHFPGRTIRIELFECWHALTCRGCLQPIDFRNRCRAQRRATRAKS